MDDQDTVTRTITRVALAGVVQLASGAVPATGQLGRVVFLESADHVSWARTLCERGGIVFAPGPGDLAAGVLGCEGALAEPGDELLVADELFVHTQDYLATPFLAVAGPTIVRISGPQDHDAFLQDADLARGRGVFVEQLLNPAVFLADQCALGTDHPCSTEELFRLHVTESGEVRTAPGGQPLGTTKSTTDELRAAAVAPGDVCLNGVVDAVALDAGREQRPWLSRYLRTIDVLRGLRADGRSGFRVSGFGARLTPGLPADLVEPHDAPLLLWNDEEHLVCDAVGGRVFRLGADAARLVELFLLTGSVNGTCELAAEHLDLAHDTTRDAVAVLATRFAGTRVLA